MKGSFDLDGFLARIFVSYQKLYKDDV
jgi:hypothetical protein